MNVYKLKFKKFKYLRKEYWNSQISFILFYLALLKKIRQLNK
jgi:hypothetical protein